MLRKCLTLRASIRKTVLRPPNLNLVPSRVQKEMHAEFGAPFCATLDHESANKISPRTEVW
jgi:hypothetical protein